MHEGCICDMNFEGTMEVSSRAYPVMLSFMIGEQKAGTSPSKVPNRPASTGASGSMNFNLGVFVSPSQKLASCLNINTRATDQINIHNHPAFHPIGLRTKTLRPLYGGHVCSFASHSIHSHADIALTIPMSRPNVRVEAWFSHSVSGL